jgi:hypothetical protein
VSVPEVARQQRTDGAGPSPSGGANLGAEALLSARACGDSAGEHNSKEELEDSAMSQAKAVLLQVDVPHAGSPATGSTGQDGVDAASNCQEFGQHDSTECKAAAQQGQAERERLLRRKLLGDV